MSDINIKIGLKIRLERTKRKLSQEKLAELSDLSKVSIGAIERAEWSPTIETLAKIASALKFVVGEFNNIKLLGAKQEPEQKGDNDGQER